MQRIILSICILLFSILNVHSQLNDNLSINCSKTESPCGANICYDPKRQNCTKTEVVRCKANCSNSCYDPVTQRCLNGMICGMNEQLCFVKYSEYGYLYPYPFYECYNPLNQTCLNNSICSYPSRVCNNQCVSKYQVCADNTTTCDVDIITALNYKTHPIKLCNGSCYNSETHECKNNSIKCIDSNCSGTCYNSSVYQCINGTTCKINSKICTVGFGSESSSECYDPSSEICLNNTICDYPSRACNQQCLGYRQVCVNNSTICDVPNWYNEYEPDQIKLCNGKCYDSKIQRCAGNSIRCIGGTCSDQCYNSSQQCLNGTICDRNEQVCDLKYGSNRYQCYKSSTQVCLNNILCDYPSRLCNQQCLTDYQICVNNDTICNIDSTYKNFPANQIKLCNVFKFFKRT